MGPLLVATGHLTLVTKNDLVLHGVIESARLSPWNVNRCTRSRCHFRISGSPGWARTSDNLINSQTLYQLSYKGTKGRPERLSCGG